ncbi:hypothetical protein ACFWZ4_03750 [Frateuria sp. GZRe12]|uniref:hypothetical protein n=1 Tax=Frateuria sp. GZRe12 TaxID=3351533 RepID=UPI003EDCB258
MKDTIDLLETIGGNASLRHAPADEMARLLEQGQASPALVAAVASRDRSMLSAEFGQQPNLSPQSVQMPAHEEQPLEEEPLDGPAPAQS